MTAEPPCLSLYTFQCIHYDHVINHVFPSRRVVKNHNIFNGFPESIKNKTKI